MPPPFYTFCLLCETDPPFWFWGASSVILFMRSAAKSGCIFFPPAAACEIYDFLFIQSCIARRWSARGAFNAPHNSDLCVSYERIFCHLFIHLRRLVIRGVARRACASFDFCTRAESLWFVVFSSWGSHSSINYYIVHRQQFAVRNNELWKLGRHTRVCFSTRESLSLCDKLANLWAPWRLT